MSVVYSIKLNDSLGGWGAAAWQLKTRSNHPDEARKSRERNEVERTGDYEAQDTQFADDTDYHIKNDEPSGQQPHSSRRDGNGQKKQAEWHTEAGSTRCEKQVVQRESDLYVARNARLRQCPLDECR